MKKILALTLLCTCLFTVHSTAQRRRQLNGNDSLTNAQRQEIRKELKAKYDSLSPEQKQKVKEKIKAGAENMPADKKKELRKELRAKYDSLSPEEKQKLKQDIMNRADSTATRRPARRKISN